MQQLLSFGSVGMNFILVNCVEFFPVFYNNQFVFLHQQRYIIQIDCSW